MTRNDLIVLIPWAIFGVALILISIRLQISSYRSQHRPAPPALRTEASGEEPADGPDAATPDERAYRQRAASS